MIKERKLYIEKLNKNGLDVKGRQQAEAAIAATDIKAHGKPIPFSYIPLILNASDMQAFNSVIMECQVILAKITRHYIEEPAYRRIFGFSTEMEHLICMPCNYPEIIPVGRYDIFLNENTGAFQICEFNTDGSGGMSRDYEISREIIRNFGSSMDGYSLAPIKTIELIAEQLINIYFTDKNAVPQPTFAVTDFREEGVFSDFNRFIQVFKAHGINARFTDVRDMRYVDGQLIDTTDGTVINGIYRRLVTSVMLERIDECQELVKAVENEAVVLLGHFRTSIAHSKMINTAMHHSLTRELLTPAENAWVQAHIPATYALDTGEITDEQLDAVIKEKNSWLLKPKEGFASHGIISGMDMTAAEWARAVASNMDKGYLVQHFCERYSVPVLGTGADAKIEELPLMLGIYQAGGHAVGCYSRAGAAGVIDFDHGGLLVTTMLATQK